MVKNPPAIWETWGRSLGQEDPLEEEMPTHSNILAWRIPRQRSLVAYSPRGLKELDTAEHSPSKEIASLHTSVREESFYYLKIESSLSISDSSYYSSYQSFSSAGNACVLCYNQIVSRCEGDPGTQECISLV